MSTKSSVTNTTDSQRRAAGLVRMISSRSTPVMPSRTPRSSSQPMLKPVFARRLSSWRGGVVTGGVVTGGFVVVVTGGVVVTGVVVVVEVEVGGVVVVVDEDVVVDVVVSVVLVVVLVVVHGVVVVVDVVVVVSSPLGTGAPRPGRSFGHHAFTHTRWSPEASASGPAP
ncbi:hypothetical protein ABZ345_35760 [Lentzea sp. NPDC005914]|uniref:hypothetical protein n=1 Tax=Lentzea sp. NPDC005914 TaxID=3154572 RepID=UPI0033D5BC33